MPKYDFSHVTIDTKYDKDGRLNSQTISGFKDAIDREMYDIQQAINAHKKTLLSLPKKIKKLEEEMDELAALRTQKIKHPCHWCGRESSKQCEYGCDGHDKGEWQCSKHWKQFGCYTCM